MEEVKQTNNTSNNGDSDKYTLKLYNVDVPEELKRIPVSIGFILNIIKNFTFDELDFQEFPI